MSEWLHRRPSNFARKNNHSFQHFLCMYMECGTVRSHSKSDVDWRAANDNKAVEGVVLTANGLSRATKEGNKPRFLMIYETWKIPAVAANASLQGMLISFNNMKTMSGLTVIGLQFKPTIAVTSSTVTCKRESALDTAGELAC